MLRPTGNRILIDPIYQSEMVGALYVPAEKTTFRHDRPNNAVEAITKGRVLRKGVDCRSDVAVGDVVQFSDSCMRMWDENGHRYGLIREDDIALVEG